ncbi:MAG: hypothetical protein AAF449_00055 [Myxococcota bacterium]
MTKVVPMIRAFLSLASLTAFACGGSTPPPPPPPVAVAPPPPPPPRGPTRTDFKTISKKLLARCVRGGWIDRWRSEHQNVDTARPKVFLDEFQNKTGQDMDPGYLNTILAQRMRLSGVFEIVDDVGNADFIGRGKLLRLAERDRQGRYSVYTAILDVMNPVDRRTVHSCEASVQGEM